MSKQTEQESSNEPTRVRIGKLAQQDKELKSADAEIIRGGGGASGGVLGDKSDQIIRKPAQ